MSSPQPFKIPYLDEELLTLERKLKQLRWPERLPGAAWEAGADIDYLRSFCDYWRDDYDWRAAADRLNAIAQFSATIDGVSIPFWHIRSPGQKGRVIPLMLLHGWPGSQVEFEKLVVLLNQTTSAGKDAPTFDIVVPALPGFGFAGKPTESGWNADRIADALDVLMHDVLGYPRYGVQGGDWGALVGSRLAHRRPSNLLGLHLNMPAAGPPPGTAPDPRMAAMMMRETGYLHVQNTKPDMLTIGQSDSPLALASWILEKFWAWSDHGGTLDAFPRETLATNLMFYWLTRSAGSAARIYFESAKMTPPLMQMPRITVPTGIAKFPKEPFQGPREWVEAAYNVVRWTDMPKGGHFPALEQPELLAQDVRAFFTELPV